MKSGNIDVLASPARLQEAFERVRPEFAKMRKKTLVPLNVDPIVAASIIRAALPRVRTLQAAIQKELGSFDPGILEKLDQYTLALVHAQRLCICAKQPPERLRERIEQIRAIREQLQSDVACLATRGLIKEYRRTALRASTSFRNLASDVLTLTELFRKNWSTVSHRSAVTLEELNDAEAAANDLIAILGVRDRSPEVVAEAALERQKVYSLCHAAYDQVRKAVIVVRWDHGDASDFAPALHGPRRPRRKSKNALAQALPTNAVAEPMPPTGATNVTSEDLFIN
jgi:hypothetical protein